MIFGLKHRGGDVVRNNTVRIDEDAFNRGVDEILQLKPIRRVFGQIIHAYAPPKAQAPKGKPPQKRPLAGCKGQ